MIEVIHPKDLDEWHFERAKDVTSTETPALFGASSYLTEFELGVRKKSGLIVRDDDPPERIKWGLRLQDAIAQGIAEDEGFTIRKKTEYIRETDCRAGASFDFEITNLDGLLEIKNVDYFQFKKEWLVDDEGNIQAPVSIEIQAQQQMWLAKKEFNVIGPLIGGNMVRIEKRIADKVVQNLLRERIEEFWYKIAKGILPEPDFERDAKSLAALYQNSNESTYVAKRGSDMDELVHMYVKAQRLEKECEKRKQAIKSRILHIAKHSKKVLGEGYSISLPMIKESTYQVTRKAYRGFKVSVKGEDEKTTGKLSKADGGSVLSSGAEPKEICGGTSEGHLP